MNKLLGLVARAMAIAKLTDVHISIPSSGSVTEAVLESYFSHVPLIPALTSSRRVSFACKITVIGAATESAAVREATSLSPPALPELVPMDIQRHKPVYTLFPEEDFMHDSTVVLKPDFSSLPAPPGFEKFTWPEATRGLGSIPSTFDLYADLPGWFLVGISCGTGDLPSLSVSPILSNSLDTAGAEVSDSPSGTTGERDVLRVSPPSGPAPNSSAVVSSSVPDCSSKRGFHGSPGPVPRWRLARECSLDGSHGVVAALYESNGT